MPELYDYGVCRMCGMPMIYDRMSDERPHGNDQWHPECCPECNGCCWVGCKSLASVTAEGHEGVEHFTLELCYRHWAALQEQEGSWHLIER